MVQNAHIHQSHVYLRIKLSRTIFEKGHQRKNSCEIISKFDQRFQTRRFFKDFRHVRIVQETPFHESHVYGQLIIS